jgi:hypothetical protein
MLSGHVCVKSLMLVMTCLWCRDAGVFADGLAKVDRTALLADPHIDRFVAEKRVKTRVVVVLSIDERACL